MTTWPSDLGLPALARAVTPQGAQTLSKRPQLWPQGDGDPPHPLYLARGQGSHVWDHRDRRYIDWIMGLAPLTLGHAHPAVTAAVVRQARRLALGSQATEQEVYAAEDLLWTLGLSDTHQVRWTSTGSEATEAAIRCARIATGRDVILSIGYHSWYSTFTAAKAYRPGVPEAYRNAVVEVPPPDPDAGIALEDRLEEAFAVQGAGRVAGVIVEWLFDPPPHEVVALLYRLCQEAGALLIWDEVVTGFRHSIRGLASQYLGWPPDLLVYGKAIGGGYPVGALVGRQALLEMGAWPASGTFSGHPVSMAAIRAVLTEYRQRGQAIIDRIREVGWALRQGLEEATNRETELWPLMPVPTRWHGQPYHPAIEFGPATPGDPQLGRDAMTRFLWEAARGGVLWHPGGVNPSAVHTDQDVRRTVRVLGRALRWIWTHPDALLPPGVQPINPSLPRGTLADLASSSVLLAGREARDGHP